MPDKVIGLTMEHILDVAHSKTRVFEGVSPQFLKFLNGPHEISNLAGANFDEGVFLEDLVQACSGFQCLVLIECWCEQSKMSTGVIGYSRCVFPAVLLTVTPVQPHAELDAQEEHIEFLSIVFLPNLDIFAKLFDDFYLLDKSDEHLRSPLTLDQFNCPIDIDLPRLSDAVPLLQIVLALLTEL